MSEFNFKLQRPKEVTITDLVGMTLKDFKNMMINQHINHLYWHDGILFQAQPFDTDRAFNDLMDGKAEHFFFVYFTLLPVHTETVGRDDMQFHVPVFEARSKMLIAMAEWIKTTEEYKELKHDGS